MYEKLITELNKPEYNNKKVIKLTDPLANLIEQIRKFSLYERCLKDGKIVVFDKPLDYTMVNRTANVGYTSVERDYYINWAKELKAWVNKP